MKRPDSNYLLSSLIFMTRLFYSALLLLSISTKAYTQWIPGRTLIRFDNPAYASEQHKLILKLAPLSLIDITPTVQAGIEYLFTSHFGLQQEVGYGNFSYWESKQVFRLRTEARYYLSPQNNPGFYLALEGFYKYLDDSGHYKFFFIFPTREPEPEQRSIFGLHFKWGKQLLLGKNWILDMYMGVGFRRAKVHTWQQERTDYEQPGGPLVFPAHYQTYYENWPSLTLGVKIGYCILNKR
jgi:hypothetical protein